MRMPSCAPRPVPTSSAVGVARPSAHGQAMISTATAALNAALAVAGASQPRDQRGDGERRSRRARTRPTPGRRGVARAPCRSAPPRPAGPSGRACVSAPTRVARTTSRPSALTVAPVTGSPGPTSTGTLSPVTSDASTAEAPSTTTPSVAIFSPGRTTNRSPTASSPTGTSRSVPSASSTATSLAPEVEQGPQRVAGAALGPGLEVAAGEDERDDGRRDLEVDVRRSSASSHPGHATSVIFMPMSPARREQQRAQRPADTRR